MSNVVILILLFIFLLFLLAVLFYLIYTAFIQPGAVYYPTTVQTAKDMVDCSGATKKDIILDLGSGDGRILIEFAKKGIKGLGYEIDPLLVYESRKKISQKGLSDLITVHLKSFWLADFNQASIIVLYLFPHFMDRLQKLLEKKLSRPLILISNTYQFPHKKYFKKKGQLYFYKFP